MAQRAEAMLVLGWFSKTQQRVLFARDVSRMFGVRFSEAKRVVDLSLNVEDLPVIVRIPVDAEYPWLNSDEAERWFLYSFGVSVAFVSSLSDVDVAMVRRVIERIVGGLELGRPGGQAGDPERE